MPFLFIIETYHLRFFNSIKRVLLSFPKCNFGLKISRYKYAAWIHNLINFIRVSFHDLRNLYKFNTSYWLPGSTVILKFHRFRIAIFWEMNTGENIRGMNYFSSLWRASFSRWSNRRKRETRLPEFTLSHEYVMAQLKKKRKKEQHTSDSRFVKSWTKGLNSWCNEIIVQRNISSVSKTVEYLFFCALGIY